MSRRTLLAGLVLTAIASGCGERPEPTTALAPAYPVTVQGFGEEPTVLEERPERIAALDPGTAELVAALGAATHLVGVPAGYTGDRGEKAVVVAGSNGQVDVAAAADARPDLVATAAATDAFDAQAAADEAGAPLYVQPDRRIADVIRSTVELGDLVGTPVEARGLAESLHAEVRRIDAEVAALPSVRVFVDTGFLVTVAPSSLAADLVRRAGGVDVAPDDARPRAYELCEVVRLRPEVFLRLTEPGDPSAAPSLERCGRRGDKVRYVELRADLVTRAGPRIPAALEAIARALHPDAF